MTRIDLYAVLIAVALTCIWNPAQVMGQGLLRTGITGQITSLGLENPQYVLSFQEVQHLMLGAAEAPVSESAVRNALQGTPVELRHLLDHGLLTKVSHDRYRLSYLLLTVRDQEKIDEVAERFGANLAQAISARGGAFKALLSNHPQSQLRDDLLFGLVAGFLLNWDGLALSTALGYRVGSRVHPNGDRYLVHSAESGASLETKGLYSGSHTYPGPEVSFSTFGDGPSQPRVYGIPDSYTEPLQAGFRVFADAPPLLAALQPRLLEFVTEELNHLGKLILATAREPGPVASLASRTDLDEGEVSELIRVLESTGYLTETDGAYRPRVAVLTTEDQAIVDGVAALGKEILIAWLQENHPLLERELSGLSAVRSGVPFELAFSEVWHSVFGHATRLLSESDFYTDPYDAGRMHAGFVPLVWASSLRPPPP